LELVSSFRIKQEQILAAVAVALEHDPAQVWRVIGIGVIRRIRRQLAFFSSRLVDGEDVPVTAAVTLEYHCYIVRSIHRVEVVRLGVRQTYLIDAHHVRVVQLDVLVAGALEYHPGIIIGSAGAAVCHSHTLRQVGQHSVRLPFNTVQTVHFQVIIPVGVEQQPLRTDRFVGGGLRCHIMWGCDGRCGCGGLR
jgi:hypothetical protein